MEGLKVFGVIIGAFILMCMIIGAPGAGWGW